VRTEHAQRPFVVPVAVVALRGGELEHGEEVELEEVGVFVDETVLADALEDAGALALGEELLGCTHEPELHSELRAEDVQQEAVLLLADLRKLDRAVGVGEPGELCLGFLLLLGEALRNDTGAVELAQYSERLHLLVQEKLAFLNRRRMYEQEETHLPRELVRS